MTKTQLIKLIHIAKSQLGLDDETYRALLIAETKKKSCSKMFKNELESVYAALKSKGFQCTSIKNSFGRTVVRVAEQRADIRKIKAIWITMGQQGFLSDPSDNGLDAFVERVTKKYTGGLGIKSHAWLDANLASHVLESLKQWHLRVIVDCFLCVVEGVRYVNGVLQWRDMTLKGYDEIAERYAACLTKLTKKRSKK